MVEIEEVILLPLVKAFLASLSLPIDAKLWQVYSLVI